MYWINLWREISLWRMVKKVTKQNSALLEENNLRVDWIGRIYTVFNLPPEVLETPNTKEPWLSAQLKNVDDVLIQLNLSDVVYPEFTQIEGTNSYLLVLYPETEYINLTLFIWNLILWGGGIYFLIVMYRWASTFQWFQNLFSQLSKHL